MPQVAIKGVYRDGIITPIEKIPFQEPKEVIIVFIDNYADESRYETAGWKLAEKQASEDYRTGNIKTATSIDNMMEEIENAENGN